MKVPFFVPWISKNDKDVIIKTLNQRWLTNGPSLNKFEENFQKYLNVKYAIGVSTATHGLHLILKSLNIKKNDEVIVPTMTFSATADAVSYCNGKPILVDVDKNTFNIHPNEIKKNITKKTKGIVVVHYGGQSCDMNEILSIASKKSLFVVEDCAHALGSTYFKKNCGNIGIAGCFSFYATKIITTAEGGMITTNDKKIATRTRLLRSHGMSKTPKDREKTAEWEYDIHEMGFNYRLDEIRASLGLSQLKRIQTINKLRQKIAKEYDKRIKKINGITIPYKESNRNHIYHLYTIKIEKNYHLTRNQLFKKLHQKGIGSSVQFTPLHLMLYNKGKYNVSRFPNSNKLKDQILSLPIFPKMTIKQIEMVTSTLNN